MKKTTFRMTMVIYVIFLITSCSKSSDAPVITSKEALLTSHSWVSDPRPVIIDSSYTVDPLISFSSNKTFTNMNQADGSILSSGKWDIKGDSLLIICDDSLLSDTGFCPLMLTASIYIETLTNNKMALNQPSKTDSTYTIFKQYRYTSK
jgi:hypothetical protein